MFINVFKEEFETDAIIRITPVRIEPTGRVYFTIYFDVRIVPCSPQITFSKYLDDERWRLRQEGLPVPENDELIPIVEAQMQTVHDFISTHKAPVVFEAEHT